MNDPNVDQASLSPVRLTGWRDIRSSFATLVVILITIGLVIALVRKVNVDALRTAFGSLDLRFAVLAIGLMALVVMIVAARWRLVVRLLDHHITLARAALVILSTSAVNAVVPAKAGNLIKVASLRGVLPMASVLGTAISEGMIDLSVLGLLAFVGSLVTGRTLTAAVSLAIAGGAAMFMIFSTFLPRLPVPRRVHTKFVEFSAVMGVFRQQPLRLLTVFVTTVLIWLSMISLTWMLYRGVGAEASFLQVCTAMPLAIFAGLLPLTLSGIGTRDMTLIVLMSSAATEAQSLAVGILYTVIVYWLPAVVGAPLLRHALRAK